MAAGVARVRQHLIELSFEHRLQEFPGSLTKASFDRVEPVVEKLLSRLDFGLRQTRRRDSLRHGAISASAETPESLVGPSWRLRRHHFPTTLATAPKWVINDPRYINIGRLSCGCGQLGDRAIGV
jgi:hypothetical protein